MQCRWNLIFATLKDYYETHCDKKEVFSNPESLVTNLSNSAGFPSWFKQLGNVGGKKDDTHDKKLGRAQTVHSLSDSDEALEEACEWLNAYFGSHYRRVSSRHRMTPDILRKKHVGEDAVDEFLTLITTGVTSIVKNTEHALMLQKRAYFPSTERDEMEALLVSRLAKRNGGKSIQCIVAPGAPTGLEALAVRLSEQLPEKLTIAHESSPSETQKPPARSFFVIPCGRWIPPVAFRGMEYLVYNILSLLRDEKPAASPPEMSETELHAGIDEIRATLGHRSLILIFVGLEAVSGPLPNLRRAVADSPLAELLTYLSQPTQGKLEDPHDVNFFDWTYFVVLGTTAVEALEEYQQLPLELAPLDNKHIPAVLREVEFRHADEASTAIPKLLWNPTESGLSVFEQMRRIEKGVAAKPGGSQTASSLAHFEGLGAIVGKLVEAILDDAFDAVSRVVILLVAFSITGMRRATLIRCLALWEVDETQAGPQTLDNFPKRLAEWNLLFEQLLDDFSPLIRLGPDENWTELDPHRHPFEYPDDDLFGLATNQDGWWTDSIDFLYSDVQEHLNAAVCSHSPRLAFKIHNILHQEAYRQHTLVLRHTFKTSRTTLRSYRRGLESLYHGLVSLPLLAVEESTTEQVNDAVDRFFFLYLGLFDLILGPKSHESSRTEWGADLIKFEIGMYVQSTIFSLFSELTVPTELARDTQPMDIRGGNLLSSRDIARHYIALGATCFRIGPNNSWDDVRPLLARFDRMTGGKSVAQLILLQIDGLSFGPVHAKSSGRCSTLLHEYGIDTRSFDFESDDGERASHATPSISELDEKVNHTISAAHYKSDEERADVISLLMLFGIFRSAAAESKRPDKLQVTQLLGYAVPFLAALGLLERLPGGKSVARPPYLAAEGVRMFARLGLEILRIQQKPNTIQSTEADALTNDLTGRVRSALDYYTQQFHENENERAHMLILESQFARVAYRSSRRYSNYVHVPSSSNPSRKTATTLISSDMRRHQLALDFLSEAEASLLRTHPSDSLNIRFLIERCCVLRGLSRSLLRNIERSVQPPPRTHPELIRAEQFFRLAERDVALLTNIVVRLKHSEVDILSNAGKQRWDSIVEQLAVSNKALHRDLLQAYSRTA
jgi:hypothetical protein